METIHKQKRIYTLKKKLRIKKKNHLKSLKSNSDRVFGRYKYLNDSSSCIEKESVDCVGDSFKSESDYEDAPDQWEVFHSTIEDEVKIKLNIFPKTGAIEIYSKGKCLQKFSLDANELYKKGLQVELHSYGTEPKLTLGLCGQIEYQDDIKIDTEAQTVVKLGKEEITETEEVFSNIKVEAVIEKEISVHSELLSSLPLDDGSQNTSATSIASDISIQEIGTKTCYVQTDKISRLTTLPLLTSKPKDKSNRKLFTLSTDNDFSFSKLKAISKTIKSESDTSLTKTQISDLKSSNCLEEPEVSQVKCLNLSLKNEESMKSYLYLKEKLNQSTDAELLKSDRPITCAADALKVVNLALKPLRDQLSEIEAKMFSYDFFKDEKQKLDCQTQVSLREKYNLKPNRQQLSISFDKKYYTDLQSIDNVTRSIRTDPSDILGQVAEMPQYPPNTYPTFKKY